jgi:hypothetical protein
MSTLTYTGPAASEKQISFVTDLIAKRDVDVELAGDIAELIALGVYTKAQASENIDAFLKLPKRAAASAARTGMQALLASVPKSKYAIPVDELELTDADDVFHGDLVFLEIKEYMQTLYVRQLHGAPGGFSRSKLSAKSVTAIVEILARDSYKYAKTFGEHYSCCGSCGAELTDPRSRELQLGPECRKKFGF